MSERNKEQNEMENKQFPATDDAAKTEAIEPKKVPASKTTTPEQQDTGTNATGQADGDETADTGDTTGIDGGAGEAGGDGGGVRMADNAGNSRKGGRGGDTAFSSDNKNEDQSAENIVKEESGTDEGATGNRGGNND